MKHTIIMSDFKMEIRIIKQEKIIKKNLQIYHAYIYMPGLEGDEEVKEGKGSKNLTPKKLLTRLPILLAQIKA